MAAVDQGKELDARRTAELHHGVERCARGAAGVDHIVDQHDGLARNGEGNVRPVEYRRVRDRGSPTPGPPGPPRGRLPLKEGSQKPLGPRRDTPVGAQYVLGGNPLNTR